MRLLISSIITISFFFPIFYVQASVETKKTECYELASYFVIARDWVSKRKSVISEPKTFPPPEKYTKSIQKAYKKKFNKDFNDKNMIAAVEAVITRAKNGDYDGNENWKDTKYSRSNSHLYESKFLPARFATEVQKEFNKKTGGNVKIKLTAPADLIVNLANEPDKWEVSAFDKIKANPHWSMKEPVIEQFPNGSFRCLLPETYKAGCIGCHTGEAGAKIHRSGKAGVSGGLGGGISIQYSKSN